MNRSDIEAWGTTHLETAATHWRSAAERWEGHFETIHTGMLRPGGTAWEGAAADAAAERSWGDLVKVRGAGDALYAAAGHATTGADDIAWAKRQVLDAIAEAEESGFTVGQDFSVTDKSSGALMRSTVARQQQAQTFAAEISERVQTLAALDKRVAGKITAALAPLRGMNFGEPTVQAAGFRTIKDAPAAPEPPPPPPPLPKGPSGDEIAKVLDQLPSDSRPNIRVVRSKADIDRLWEWMKRNGVENPGRYRGTDGVSMDLPDGTSIGQRSAAGSTGEPALDVNVPGKGYIKVHINPEKGAAPAIPEATPPAPAKPAPAEAPSATEAAPKAQPAEPNAPRAPVTETAPGESAPGGFEGGGGAPGFPMGPQPVHPPGSIHHPFPILGEDDPTENPRDFEGH
ncbi:hypothetical protein FZI85_29935 [Mycobacterium sp. CBMA293]|uniref:hypothetical protein n=1 Tax=unclassified Mycolicibacterium TaxID=2636767 RepID=UPI0012DF124A|nr:MULTISPECIES: hypothetical protein [unclassified Mycolicibacterium]MUL50058.1 hypothetical protein [Mycolicibacterium sp. CBMA 360]MUL62742.1 hypothetical protein [Mycolicibacterium sp. CBMA 335]MUL69614.1 hypothetical protein [Mycolicibacterium sp. CBMA 311]MUL97400.1 hypothetical protein [Mycolicibacterium sp. CBMA 230]MUM15214.1 hypothetical protein [Mycolicibacterium sp. CBMA 293]